MAGSSLVLAKQFGGSVSDMKLRKLGRGLVYQLVSATFALSVAHAEPTPAKDAALSYNLADAVSEVKKTKRPMFAVSYSNTCPICQGLLKLLDTEESLRPITAQFVHARINVESPEFRTWERRYPRPSTAIPGVYVVDSDGKALVLKAGGQSVDELQLMLTESLEQMGRLPDAELLQALTEAAEEARPAVEAGEFQRAMAVLKPVEPDLARVYDSLALIPEGKRIRAVVDSIVSHAEENLQRAEMASPPDPWKSAWLITSTAGDFGQLPPVKEKSDEAKARFSETAAQKRLLQQAQELHRAQVLFSQDRSTKGQAALKRVITKFPGTAAAQQAAALLVGKSAEASVSSTGAMRKWTDRTGKFSVDAEFLGTTGDVVRLKRADGKILSVPLAKLSDESKQFVSTQAQGL
jgi:hypothetical protein